MRSGGSNIALGSGVLGFPAAYHAGGYLYTTAFIAAFALLGCFSNSIMIRCCSWHRVVSFQGVVREALGPRIATVAAIAMVVYSFGGCAAFLVIIGDFLEPPCSHASAALGWAEADGEASSSAACDGSAAAPGACSRQVLIVAVGLTVVLPLSLRAQITFLGAPSRFAIVGVVFLSLAVVFRSASAVAERGLASGVVPFVDTAAGVIGPTGTVAWSFAVMLGIPSVFAELQAGAGDGTRLLGGAQRDSEELQQLTERRSRAERQQGGFDGGGLDEVEVSAEEAGRVAEMDGVIRQQAVLTAACYVAGPSISGCPSSVLLCSRLSLCVASVQWAWAGTRSSGTGRGRGLATCSTSTRAAQPRSPTCSSTPPGWLWRWSSLSPSPSSTSHHG